MKKGCPSGEAKAPKSVGEEMEKIEVGKVFNYFAKIGVAALDLTGDLKVGDKIYVEASEPFEQAVESMQIEHEPVQEAKAGQGIGMKMAKPCHKNNRIYKIVD